MPFARLHFLPEAAGFDVVVAHELDVVDFDLRAFADLERDDAETRAAIAFEAVVDLGLVVARLLVKFVEFLRVFLHLALVERTVLRALDFLLQPAGLVLLVAFVTDRQHAVLRRDLEHEVDRIADVLALDLDEFEQTRAVKRPDVAVDDCFVQVRAFTQSDVRAHDLLADIGHTDKLDRDRANLRGRPLRRRLRLLLRKQPGEPGDKHENE